MVAICFLFTLALINEPKVDLGFFANCFAYNFTSNIKCVFQKWA